ncbi:MAG: hypothetical protein K2G51_00110 [Lachnospiraceae bacterium]|nr:hypothetical protein [Lachnospiraceae bacterium]MDE7273845.1 hypothetical protein [Lachnospiraceae bacterium]
MVKELSTIRVKARYLHGKMAMRPASVHAVRIDGSLGKGLAGNGGKG